MSNILSWRLLSFYTCRVIKNVVFANQCIRSLSTSSPLYKKDPISKKWNRTTLPDDKKYAIVEVWPGITIDELSQVTKKSVDEIEEAMILLDLELMVTFDDVARVCKILCFKCIHVKPPEERIQTPTILKPLVPKLGSLLKPRPPVVTIMGHVDHGKTTILDALRKSEIVKSEYGGITQHIGAFVVSLDDPHGKKVKLSTRMKNVENLVTFLDTPGHAAFHAMRERGANVTDIVVLVVAADDGIMDQTEESIKFAQSAKVPIVVAVNKIDKVNMNDPAVMEKIKRGLMVHGILLEEDGGDTQVVKVSGLTGEGLNELKEAIIALAETIDLRSPSDGDVNCNVIESSIDAGRGRLASLLIRSGTLKRGDVLVSNSIEIQPSWAKVRSMFDEFGNVLESVPPGFPVQVIGWKDETLPSAGENIISVKSEKEAKEFVARVRSQLNELKAEQDFIEGRKKYESLQKDYKEHLQTKWSSDKARSRYARLYLAKNDERLKIHTTDPDANKKINLVIKADVNGSLEVLLDVFGSYNNEKEPVKVNVIGYGIGPPTESDLHLAEIFPNTIIYAFNVKIPPTIYVQAKKSSIPVRPFNVIYHLVDDVKQAINEKMPERDNEVVVGEAVVQQEFQINEKGKKVPVAGSRCSKGHLKKGKEFLYRQMRKSGQSEATIVDQLEVSSMRHLKEEVDSIQKDVECGLKFTVKRLSKDDDQPEVKTSSHDLKFLPGDRLVCFRIEKIKPKTRWTPKGF